MPVTLASTRMRIHYMELKGVCHGEHGWVPHNANPLHGVESLLVKSNHMFMQLMESITWSWKPGHVQEDTVPGHPESITWSWKRRVCCLRVRMWMCDWIHYMELKARWRATSLLGWQAQAWIHYMELKVIAYVPAPDSLLQNPLHGVERAVLLLGLKSLYAWGNPLHGVESTPLRTGSRSQHRLGNPLHGVESNQCCPQSSKVWCYESITWSWKKACLSRSPRTVS